MISLPQNILSQHYSWIGVALIALFILMLLVQIYHFLFRYRKVGSYLNNKTRPKIHQNPPVISLVVPMFSEDYTYIESTLPLIMGQEGVAFEVVIVYVGSDNDFYEDILRLKEILGNITITKIERNERFPISVKTALNVGIKAARNEHILFSTTDARPTSERWLSLMAKGFQRGDVVVGYCGMEEGDTILSRYIRLSRMMESLGWLSSAINKKPYRAIRSNMGFTRTLYFKVNGFNHLNMNIGEDDLFMQRIMTKENTSIILSPRASTIEKCWGDAGWWVANQRFYRSANSLYPIWAKEPSAWEMTSRVLLFLLFIAIVVIMPFEVKAAMLILMLLRVVIMLSSINKVAKRLGESGLIFTYIIYDMFSPIGELYLRIRMLTRDSRVWR